MKHHQTNNSELSVWREFLRSVDWRYVSIMICANYMLAIIFAPNKTQQEVGSTMIVASVTAFIFIGIPLLLIAQEAHKRVKLRRDYEKEKELNQQKQQTS